MQPWTHLLADDGTPNNSPLSAAVGAGRSAGTVPAARRRVFSFRRRVSMSFAVFILFVLAFTGGCATHRSDPTEQQIRQDREELEALGAEIIPLIRQLDELQKELSTNSNYSAEIRARDLDSSLSAVREAHDKLAAKYWQLVKDYHVNAKSSY
jgi:cell division protein FtsB